MRVNSNFEEEARIFGDLPRRERLALAAMLLLLCYLNPLVRAQSGAGQAHTTETMEQKVEHLTAAVAQAQAQMEAYQKQLIELRQQLAALQLQMAAEKAASSLTTQPAIA